MIRHSEEDDCYIISRPLISKTWQKSSEVARNQVVATGIHKIQVWNSKIVQGNVQAQHFELECVFIKHWAKYPHLQSQGKSSCSDFSAFSLLYYHSGPLPPLKTPCSYRRRGTRVVVVLIQKYKTDITNKRVRNPPSRKSCCTASDENWQH